MNLLLSRTSPDIDQFNNAQTLIDTSIKGAGGCLVAKQ